MVDARTAVAKIPDNAVPSPAPGVAIRTHPCKITVGGTGVSRETSLAAVSVRSGEVLLAQTGELLEVALDERQSLRPAPPLNLLLAPIRISDAIELLEVEETYRQAAARVGGAIAVAVLSETVLKVSCAAHVE